MPLLPRPDRSHPVDTPSRILDAAEALFIEKGFAATAMRAIAERAGVNLAAAHYHFGSKQALLLAVFHRRVLPINEQRLKDLDRLEAGAAPPDVDDLLDVFLTHLAVPHPSLPALIARIYGEPDSVSRPLIEGEFSEVGQRFTQALARALPEVGLEEIRWRFHFVVGAMIHLIAGNAPFALADSPPGRGLAELRGFAKAGLMRPATMGDQGDHR